MLQFILFFVLLTTVSFAIGFLGIAIPYWKGKTKKSKYAFKEPSEYKFKSAVTDNYTPAGSSVDGQDALKNFEK